MSDQVTASQNQKQFILTDNLWKVMFQLSWPAVIAMVLYGFNSVLDVIFIGQFVGETAVAGVSLAYPLSQLSTGLGSMIGVGAGSVLSIALGANDQLAQKKLMGNVNIMTIISTIVFMVLALVFSRPLVAFMGGTGAELELGIEYFRVSVFGSIFWIYGLAGNMIVRAEGRMKKAAWMMATGLIVNALFNYLFIVVMDMGVAGAAWGTNLGMLAYSLVGWIYFSSGKATFRSKVFSLSYDKEVFTSILRLGIPSFIMQVMSLIQALVVFNALSRVGTTADIAFYGVAYRVFQFGLTPIFGLMRALQPAIGINYGARQYERSIKAYKLFGVAAMVLTIPLWLVSLTMPEAILGMMLTEQAFTGVQLMQFRMFMAIVPLMSFIFMSMTLFPAIDKGKPAAMIGMARQFVFYIPVMLIVPRFVGVTGIYIGSLLIDLIILLWTIFLVNKEFSLLRDRGDEAGPGMILQAE